MLLEIEREAVEAASFIGGVDGMVTLNLESQKQRNRNRNQSHAMMQPKAIQERVQKSGQSRRGGDEKERQREEPYSLERNNSLDQHEGNNPAKEPEGERDRGPTAALVPQQGDKKAGRENPCEGQRQIAIPFSPRRC